MDAISFSSSLYESVLLVASAGSAVAEIVTVFDAEIYSLCDEISVTFLIILTVIYLVILSDNSIITLVCPLARAVIDLRVLSSEISPLSSCPTSLKTISLFVASAGNQDSTSMTTSSSTFKNISSSTLRVALMALPPVYLILNCLTTEPSCDETCKTIVPALVNTTSSPVTGLVTVKETPLSKYCSVISKLRFAFPAPAGKTSKSRAKFGLPMI